MASDNQKERDRLKEEYKEHYRRIREVKDKLKRSRYVQNINQALHQLNADELLESTDEFLHKVKSKVANFESRLDVALDHLMEDYDDQIKMEEFDSKLRKERAKETLRQVREEMGILYSELERRADNMNVQKTIGLKPSDVNPESNELPEDKEDVKE
ncbi:MAG: hypothetical protein ACFCU6_14150 [Balneolaceae bacterium]